MTFCDQRLPVSSLVFACILIFSSVSCNEHSEQPTPPSGDSSTSELVASDLIKRAAEGNFEAVRDILKSGNASANMVQSQSHSTPLALAARNGHDDVVWLLLRSGADPNVPISFGETPLNLAAVAGDVDMCRMLISAGADPLQRNDDGLDSLSVAKSVRESNQLKGKDVTKWEECIDLFERFSSVKDVITSRTM